NFWKLNAIFIKAQKDRHISLLLHQQFALQLLNKRSNQELERQLQQCQADKGLLEYNRDRLFDRYYNKFKDRKASHIKWKNRERDSQQLILNLNQQIFALQNNQPINNQYRGMAGYELPKFHGRAGEDPEVFLTDFQRWCETANYDPNAGHNMRMR